MISSPECIYHPDLPINSRIFGGFNLEVLAPDLINMV